jgi:hypothetical protein
MCADTLTVISVLRSCGETSGRQPSRVPFGRSTRYTFGTPTEDTLTGQLWPGLSVSSGGSKPPRQSSEEQSRTRIGALRSFASRAADGVRVTPDTSHAAQMVAARVTTRAALIGTTDTNKSYAVSGASGNARPGQRGYRLVIAARPLFTVRVIGNEAEERLVIEPAGGEYDLALGHPLIVHVYGRSLGPKNKDCDVEIERTPGRLILWIGSDDYRIWDDAGTEVTFLAK